MGESEPDFGAPHNRACLVEDAAGTRSVAHYHRGTWWLDHPPEHGGPGRFQLDVAPVRLIKVCGDD